jgi:hypothetical protein
MTHPLRSPVRPLVTGLGLVLLAACAAHQEDLRDPGADITALPPADPPAVLPETIGRSEADAGTATSTAVLAAEAVIAPARSQGQSGKRESTPQAP